MVTGEKLLKARRALRAMLVYDRGLIKAQRQDYVPVFKKYIRPVARLVVKLGASALGGERLSRTQLSGLVDQLESLYKDKRELIVVSSGAIITGRTRLGGRLLQGSGKNAELIRKQAYATVGQPYLMAAYGELFREYGIELGQLLLTYDDFAAKKRLKNWISTIEMLLNNGIVPIINENDAIATEEITFGDNDKLAALVARALKAELLVLLSNVDGIYLRGKRKLSLVRDSSWLERKLDESFENSGTAGGALSKLEAARLAAEKGIPTLVANGLKQNILGKIFSGEQRGTLFLPG